MIFRRKIQPGRGRNYFLVNSFLVWFAGLIRFNNVHQGEHDREDIQWGWGITGQSPPDWLKMTSRRILKPIRLLPATSVGFQQ